MSSNSYLNTSLDGGFSANQSGFSLNMLPSPQSLVDDQNETLSDMVCKNPAHKMLSTSDYVKLLWTTLAEFPGVTFYSQYLRVKKLMYCSKAYVLFLNFKAFWSRFLCWIKLAERKRWPYSFCALRPQFLYFYFQLMSKNIKLLFSFLHNTLTLTIKAILRLNCFI